MKAALTQQFGLDLQLIVAKIWEDSLFYQMSWHAIAILMCILGQIFVLGVAFPHWFDKFELF